MIEKEVKRSIDEDERINEMMKLSNNKSKEEKKCGCLKEKN